MRKIINPFIFSGLIFFIMLFSFKNIQARDKSQHKTQEDIEVISNPKKPIPKEGMRKKLVFKEELSIGVAEGDENYMFGDTVVFNTDEDGNFYVTDWDRKRIQKYDSEGKYLLTIGRKGQGPGEFQNVSNSRFDKNGLIYITDIASRRISFFDRDGKYLKQISIKEVFENLYMNSKGHFVAICSMRTDNASGFGWKIVHGLFDDHFKLVSELHSEISDTKPPEGRDQTSLAKFTANILSDMAFQPRALHILANNDCIYFGYPEKYTIDIYSPEGKKVKTIGREYDPIKVEDKDKEYFATNIAEDFLRIGPRPEEFKKEVIRFIKYPKYKPAYHRFALMENGWLLVVVEFVENEYTLFDIFDKEGIYIGNFKVNVPPDGLFFKNGKAYSVATEDGYKFVKRYSFKIREY